MKKDPTGFKKGPRKYFPAWRFGPGYVGPDAAGREDPAHARVFQKLEDVPEGWFPSPQEAKDFAAAQEVEETPGEPLKKPTPAPNKAASKKAAKPASENPSRESAIATLQAAGYDPAELAAASDAKLQAALKDIPANGSNG